MDENIKEEPNELQSQLDECKNKCDEYLNNWKRERADFLNYKKEEMEKIGLLGKYIKEDMIFKILPILDNIYLAESHLPEELKNNNWFDGFSQIKKQFLDLFSKEGIEEIKTIGQKFDPNTMEAVEEVSGVPDSAEEEPASAKASAVKAGTVIEEVQRGYKISDKILRPARVRVIK
jgi:molecular chaperone GrpE